MEVNGRTQTTFKRTMTFTIRMMMLMQSGGKYLVYSHDDGSDDVMNMMVQDADDLTLSRRSEKLTRMRAFCLCRCAYF